MRGTRGSDDDDDEELDRSSPFLRTQRFQKTDTFGSKDLKSTLARPKPGNMSHLNLDLGGIHHDEGNFNDSDDELDTKTGRSTSSATSSQRTPKPVERSFLKTKDGDRPKAAPRHIDIDDDDRDVFGQGTMKPSPRPRHTTTTREDEENHRKFADGFSNDQRRKSPTNMFSTNPSSDSRRNSRKLSADRDDDIDERRHHDSDDESTVSKHRKSNGFIKSRHSSTTNDKPHSRKSSARSRDDSDKSDDDHHDERRDSDRQLLKNHRPSTHELEQTVPKDIEATTNQLPSSRPGSASKKEAEPARRSSYCEEQESVIPPVVQPQSQSRPSSAKSNTTRQQTQSAIDNVTSANMPHALDPLTANNEALAAALQPTLPPPPPPRPSAQLPPRPKPNPNPTMTGGIHKKQQFKVPSRYKEITSRVDTGRKPTSEINLTASIQRALEKELKSQTLPRPQTARTRALSATNKSNDTSRQRRRSTSGYENVKPRVNTHLSINFDELNNSQLRAESSQSIKDGVYLEWLKTKVDQRVQDKELTKRWEEDKAKRVDKSQIQRRIEQNMRNLDLWRQEKEEQIRKKKQEELAFKREQKEKHRQEELQKKKDAKDGFENWKLKKDEKIDEKIDHEQNRKAAIEKQQEEKQKRVVEAEKAYDKWNAMKTNQIKKAEEAKKANREEQLKKLHETKETKFVSAQDAYEKWLQDKEKTEVEGKLNTSRRNSLSSKPQMPFLPGGAQKNTGKIPHVVW